MSCFRDAGLDVEMYTYAAGTGIKHDYFIDDPKLMLMVDGFVKRVPLA